jgi:DNA-binding PadR family transcriptional regulator
MLQYYDHVAQGLSTNSYAVLGMLALRPWTPYELTQQFLRSLTWCWPVSERQLYTEPERLVAAGLVKVKTAGNGPRARREYSIKPAGRKALKEWLATPTSAPRIFNEPLLRVLYADQGDKDDLLQALVGLREELLERFETGRARSVEYLEGTGPFPERAHLVAMFADLGQRLTSVIDEWAADSIREVSSWSSTRDLGLTEATKQTLARVVDAAHPATT